MISLILLHHEGATEYGCLGLDYKSIVTLDYIPPKFTTIEELYLNHNAIVSLSGIQAFQNLKVLHVRFNNVNQFQELNRIRNPFFMESLALTGNPLEFDKRCNEANLRQIFKNLKEYNPTHIQAKHRQERRCSNNTKRRVEFNLSTNSIIYPNPLDTIFEPSSPPSVNGTFQIDSTDRVKSFQSKERGEDSPMIATKRFRLGNDQSTKKGSNPSSHSHSHSLHPIRSFESKHYSSIPPFLSPLKSNSVTARFVPQHSLDQNSELTIDFINEQNQYLAQAFYCRNIVEKCFDVLKSQVGKKGDWFYKERLKLKGWMSLKASVSLRRIEREYNNKKRDILDAIANHQYQGKL